MIAVFVVPFLNLHFISRNKFLLGGNKPTTSMFYYADVSGADLQPDSFAEQAMPFFEHPGGALWPESKCSARLVPLESTRNAAILVILHGGGDVGAQHWKQLCSPSCLGSWTKTAALLLLPRRCCTSSTGGSNYTLTGTEQVEAECSRSASALCRQDTMNLLTDLSKLRVEFLRVLAKRGRRADLDHSTASGVRRAVVQVAPLTGCKVKAAGSIDENPV
jgi:hypothetical protein